MLLAFTELPAQASVALEGLVSALDAQKVANDAVDAAVETRVQPVLARRQAEASAFLRRHPLTRAALEDETAQWASVGMPLRLDPLPSSFNHSGERHDAQPL